MSTASTASLVNTYWKLADMNGKAVTTPADAKEVHIVLTQEGEEKRLKGFAGCNNIGGSFTSSGNQIKFTTISTRMMCAERMDVEDYLLNALSVSNQYKIKGETLELYQDSTLMARFESVYFK